jgi:hypothetical protein
VTDAPAPPGSPEIELELDRQGDPLTPAPLGGPNADDARELEPGDANLVHLRWFVRSGAA